MRCRALAGLGERAGHEMAPIFRPSGLAGQSAGLLTFARFLFLWLYPMRKKITPAAE